MLNGIGALAQGKAQETLQLYM